MAHSSVMPSAAGAYGISNVDPRRSLRALGMTVDHRRVLATTPAKKEERGLGAPVLKFNSVSLTVQVAGVMQTQATETPR